VKRVWLWERCADCKKWLEDCACICGVNPEREEKTLGTEELFTFNGLAALETKYWAWMPTAWDDYSEQYPEQFYDVLDYSEYGCSDCGRTDCGAGRYHDDCEWKIWADELVAQRKNPLYQLAEGLGLFAAMEKSR